MLVLFNIYKNALSLAAVAVLVTSCSEPGTIDLSDMKVAPEAEDASQARDGDVVTDTSPVEDVVVKSGDKVVEPVVDPVVDPVVELPPNALCAGVEKPNKNDHCIFVTSMTFDGKLGGLEGADAKCTQIANDSGYEGNYKAILSSRAANAKDRILLNDGNLLSFNVYLGDLAKVLSPASELLLNDMPVDQEILDEKGSPLQSGLAWSATTSGGIYDGTGDCYNWSNNLVLPKDMPFNLETITATRGDSKDFDNWLISGTQQACTAKSSLYCISQ